MRCNGKKNGSSALRTLLVGAILLLVSFFASPAAHAQVGLFKGITTNSRGLPAGGTYIAICQLISTIGTSNTPCSPIQTIYADSGLSIPIATNGSLTAPFASDGLGNFLFYATPGWYMAQFYGPTVNLTFTIIQVSGTGAGGGCVSGCVLTTPSGSQTVTQPAGTSLNVAGNFNASSVDSVFKADQYLSAGDWGQAINACLAAAVTAGSRVCDARGLTGSNSATHHVSIGAGQTVLWGNGQLTVSDSGTNDAIELTGDGASIYGYQESGISQTPNVDTAGFIACGIAGCTTIKNPNQGSSKINYVHIEKLYLQSNGASSKVIDMTSIGHSVVQENNVVLGTGGTSWGIFLDTSTGGLDSGDSKFFHNNISPQSAGDTCMLLRGISNADVIENNVCVLPHVGSTVIGFQFQKDTQGTPNYPNNNEVYGNDCSSASASFGQICYNIVNAKSITLGPNNRCEHVYACWQFPVDGSATGIHMVDPYLSLSNTIQLQPNEPASSMQAIDNTSENWTPSTHYGFNDLAGLNLLGNAGFEGWTGSTALMYWGGVSGTNINQAGSGIYAQNLASSGTPAIDTYTQGSFNVAIGDNATAGLGINSACIQVDSTQNYTFAFRISSTSTSVKFRPGIRLYTDANCTEADRITNVAENARVLQPANYMGKSSLAGASGAYNWQSTNASLTYNNGISCNCNVTGADWTVDTASIWRPTRNYAITFRVANAGYAGGADTGVAHSMRVFILENTAANPNVIYVDDAILSQGAISNDVLSSAPVKDSGPGGAVSMFSTLTLPGVLAAVGGTSPLGSTSGVWGDLFLGNSNTNYFHFGLSRLATNQLWTVDNVSGIVSLFSGLRSSYTNGDCPVIVKDGSGNLSLADSTSACGGSQMNVNASNATATAVSASWIPGTANADDLGSSALPWRNVYFGIAANKAVELDGSLLTANRLVKLPDEPGTVMMNTDALGCGQFPALTGDVTTTLGSCATTVAKIGGVPFTISAPVANQGLQYNGSAFVNQAPAQCYDAQTGTSYTIPNTDGGCIVHQTNAGTITDIVADGTETGFGAGFFFDIENGNALGGAVVTVNRHTSAQFRINNALVNTFNLYPQQRAYLFCYDGTNWEVLMPPTNGVVYNKDFVSQVAAIGATTMLTVPANGAYRFTAPVYCDGSSAAATVTVTLSWTDPSNTSQTLTSTAAACTTLGGSSFVDFSKNIQTKSGTTVGFNTSIVNTPTYDIRVMLEGPF